MRLCSSLSANRSVCARRARGEEVCHSRWTEHPPGGDFHLATSGDFEMAIDILTGDTAHIDEAGYVFFQSQADDLITSAGYRIGPFEVAPASSRLWWLSSANVVSVWTSC